MGLPSKVGIPTLRPRGLPGPLLVSEGAAGSRLRSVPRILPGVPSRGRPGPHLYPKGHPEMAFDPSRRFCLAFRPESVGGCCVQTDTTGRSVPRPAGALTCIRWRARNSPLIRPAGVARRSVPRSAGGPHLYRQGRTEVAFDPSRGNCPAFRPAVCPGPLLLSAGRTEVAFDPSCRSCPAFRPAARAPAPSNSGNSPVWFRGSPGLLPGA